MQPKYEPGQRVFLSGANASLIREATIKSCSGGLYTIRFSGGGGTRVRESRLFPSREAAEEEVKRRNRLQQKIDYITDPRTHVKHNW